MTTDETQLELFGTEICDNRGCSRQIGQFCYLWKGLNGQEMYVFCSEHCKALEVYHQLLEVQRALDYLLGQE